MNWTRKELLNDSTQALRKGYWKVVLTSIVLLVLGFGLSISGSLDTVAMIPHLVEEVIKHEHSDGWNIDRQIMLILLTLSGSVVILGTIVKIIASVFVENPLKVGAMRMYLRMCDPADMGNAADLTYAFDSNYVNVLKVQLIKDVIISIAFFVVVIPGFYLTYCFRMVPYLLAENPSMTWKDALSISNEMMRGQKRKVLLLDISFLLWHLIGILTLGVGEIFYVIPRKNLVDAELYRRIQSRNVTE